jgi:predicted HAD superfamily Cof-like phosphohydrolase
MSKQTLGQMVNKFNSTYKVDTAVSPVIPTEDQMDAMYSMIHEELIELSDAMDAKDPVAMADALADLIYVTAQQAAKYGFPVDPLLEEVQRSNLSKLGDDGQPIFREDGKVLKGPKFSPPDILGVLVRHSL